VELGYASTVHAAQGVTCDTVHGLVTGTESRPQLYTLLTRGRHANHVYLQVDATADLHDLDRPGPETATTATETLERLLDRDGSVQSAHSLLADLHDPALRLPVEVGRYLDAVHLAAERTTDPAVNDRLERLADQLLPGLADAPAWPALRAYLLLRAVDGTDPGQQLRLAIATGPLDEARDPAAVLHYRATTFARAHSTDLPQTEGPLPWLPRLPRRLQDHSAWGRYLTARSDLVTNLAHRVHQDAAGTRPAWAHQLDAQVADDVVGQVAVWRAAQQVSPTDPALTGPPATVPAARRWQQHLNDVTGADLTSTPPLLHTLTAGADHDPFRNALARHVDRLAHTGVNVDHHLQTAALEQPLPDDHPSAALWWRLHRHLPAATLTPPQPVPQLPAPTQPAATSPSRESQTDTALLLAGLLRLARRPEPTPPPEAGIGTDGAGRDRLLHVNQLAHDHYRNQFTGSWSAGYISARCGENVAADDRFQPGHAPHGWTALVDHLRHLGVTEDDILGAGLATRTRQGRLVDRFRDRLILPIWNQQHELSGFVARRHPDHDDTHGPRYLNTPTTTLFTKGHQLYGHHLLPPPPATHGPGGSQDRVPVLVEGPLDAIAVTLAGQGRYIGLATLGTALTPTQAAALGALRVDPVQALDNDPAGQAATTRNFWRLTQHGVDPHLATLPPGQDPADVLVDLGPAALRRLLDQAAPQGEHLLHPSADPAHRRDVDVSLRIVATRPPHTWAGSINTLSHTHHIPVQELRERLLPLAHDATQHPANTTHRGGTLTAPPVAGRPGNQMPGTREPRRPETPAVPNSSPTTDLPARR